MTSNASSQLSFERCDSLVYVSGTVMDEAGRMVPAAMVINRSQLGGGQFVDHSGSFLLAACPGDTIVVGSIGFHTRELLTPFGLNQWNIEVRLKRLRIDIGTAEVVAPRELRTILRDIEDLGYDETDYRVSNIDAFSSPITFLYQMLNRDERSKRAVAEMENRDRRYELLRELFVKYVDYDIIRLQSEEFDAFIRFSDPGDELLQQWTQYEFIRYIQQRFGLFSALPSRLNDSDYQYQWD